MPLKITNRSQADSMTEEDAKSSRWPAIWLLLLINLVAVSFLYSPGTEDMRVWQSWINDVSSFGLIGGFLRDGGLYPHNYPPLAFAILDAVARTADALHVSVFVILKCSLLLFLIATSAVYYWFTRNLILTAALELVLLLNTVPLGYIDIYFAPFLIAGLFCLGRGKLNLGIFLFALSCSIKWQPLIIAPFVATYAWNAAGQIGQATGHKIRTQIMPFAITALTIGVPLGAIFGSAVINSLRLVTSQAEHPFLSGLALNFAWIHSWVLHLAQPGKYGPLGDGQIHLIVTRDALVTLPEKLLFYLSYAVIFVVFARGIKSFQRLIVYSMLGYLAYFSFNSGVHENHLFLVCCLAWILVFLEPIQLARGINFSIAANANLILFFGLDGHTSSSVSGLDRVGINSVIAGLDVTLLFALANLCLFVGFLWHTFKSEKVALNRAT